MSIITKKEYAEFGIPQPDGSRKPVSKGYLSKPSVRELLQPAIVIDDKGKEKIDTDKADQIFVANRHSALIPIASAEAPGSDDPQRQSATSELTGLKSQRERIKLRNDELELEERLGNTLNRTEVQDTCAAAGQKIQELFRSQIPRMAEKFATMTDVRQIRTTMEQEFNQAMEIISNDLARKFGTAGRPPASH